MALGVKEHVNDGDDDFDFRIYIDEHTEALVSCMRTQISIVASSKAMTP